MPSAGASDRSGIFSKFGPREAFPEFAMKLFILFLNFVKHYFGHFVFIPHKNGFGEGAHVQHEGLQCSQSLSEVLGSEDRLGVFLSAFSGPVWRTLHVSQ
jgi:hypothetical protein